MPTRDEVWPTGTPCWIDVMVPDPGAAREFYSGLFGWDIQDGPPEAGGYLMCMLNGRPAAAISPKPEGNPFPNVWSTYLASDDVDATVAKATKAGSQILSEPMDVMTAGRIAFAIDPTGAPFGIWQGGDHLGVGVYNEPGAMVWNEVMTRDYEGAKAFYGKVFGYTYESFDELDGDFSYSTIRRAGDGAVVGGVGELEAGSPAEASPGWTVYFSVEDCDASAARAVELGATIVRDPTDTPFGRMAPLIGAQGETFSLVQPPRQAEE
jgi:predicted enzyme related to lactoylglutathione lyase